MFGNFYFLHEIGSNHLMGGRKTWLETAIEWNGKRSLLWRNKDCLIKEMLRAQ